MADPTQRFDAKRQMTWAELAACAGFVVCQQQHGGYKWFEARIPNQTTIQGQFHTNKGGWLNFNAAMMQVAGEPNPYGEPNATRNRSA